YPVYIIDLPEKKSSPQDVYSLPMIGADVAQVSGYDGEGVKVGVIDTGIDYNHPDLGGSGTEGNNADFGLSAPRVKYGWDFVGDDYDPEAGVGPTEDAYPDDCNGHGTHVAGIIGAEGDPSTGGVLGVAPKVTFGAYRVFGCEGSADTEVILAAMDKAAADGMDVVNMSLGSAFDTWPDYPDAAAADALTAAGTLVVASAGNSGDYGLFSTGSPAVGKNVISVASVENTKMTLNYFTVDPVPDVLPDGNIGYVAADGAPLPDEGETPALITGYAEDGLHTNTYGCSPLADLSGKFVLIQRGAPAGEDPCSFYTKAFNAQEANAAGVVLYNNTDGIISPTVAPADDTDPAIDIPVVFIAESDGKALAADVPTQATTMTWTDGTEAVPNPEAGAVSNFSSFGLAADLSLVPDVAAPGGNIWSTFPLEKKGYANLSGTSMAAPHVTGSVALLLQANPALKGKVAEVRAALQNTATPIDKLYAYGAAVFDGYYEPTARQGAGLIHVDKAIAEVEGGTMVTPGKISLGENRSKYKKTTLTLTNTGTTTEKYKLGIVNAVSVGAAPTTYWYDYETDKKTSVKYSSRTVTVKAGKTAKVKVSLKQPKLSTGWLYGGWITLTATDASKTLVVPFAGMYGDYQKVKVLQDIWDVNAAGTALEVAYDLPALSTSADLDDIIPATDPKPSFDLADDELPNVLFHFDYPVSNAYINVYKATASGKKGAEVFPGYKTLVETGEMGRDPAYYSFAWDGKIPFNESTTSGLTAPDGDYVLEIKVLKALGNPKSSSSWETWTSPAFTIARS
ncbi:MAG: S8 family serine peptidase, partial [Propionibacteriaceae bacterium]|nr:S8 family serine peptidase [Propionibacteriaceae bacterium]